MLKTYLTRGRRATPDSLRGGLPYLLPIHLPKPLLKTSIAPKRAFLNLVPTFACCARIEATLTHTGFSFTHPFPPVWFTHRQSIGKEVGHQRGRVGSDTWGLWVGGGDCLGKLSITPTVEEIEAGLKQLQVP